MARKHLATAPQTLGVMHASIRDGNGAGSGRVEHTHARPDMGSG
jgi:hypothetical protein